MYANQAEWFKIIQNYNHLGDSVSICWITFHLRHFKVQQSGKKIEPGPKMYDVLICLSKLFLPMTYYTCFKYIVDAKYDLVHKYDHYIELFDKYYSYTLFSVMIFILLCRVGMSVDFF